MKNKRHRRIDLTVYMKGKESPRKKGNKKKNEQRRITCILCTRTDEQKIRQKERINQGHFLTLAHHSWFGETVLVPRRFFLFSSAGVAHLCLFVWFRRSEEVVTNKSRNLKKTKTEIPARSLEYGTAKVPGTWN